jgi:hypothetical protein
MITEVPIYSIAEPIRLVLTELHSLYLKGCRISYKEIRVSLEGRIPLSLNIKQMAPDLIEPNGERMTLLGLIALEGSLKPLDKCDEIILYIRKLFLNNPQLADVDISSIALHTTIKNEAEVSMYLNLIKRYGNFWYNARFEADNMKMKSIGLSSAEAIFDQYMAFTDIRTLILESLNMPKTNVEDLTGFAADYPDIISERLEQYPVICSKMDELLSEVKLSQTGQQVLFEEMQEMKELYLKLN